MLCKLSFSRRKEDGIFTDNESNVDVIILIHIFTQILISSATAGAQTNLIL